MHESCAFCRFSSISSATTSGCWCPYVLIVLMVIFVIASLVASNFSIYFLMKDNCDANMAKMERDWALQAKRRTDSQNPSPLSDSTDQPPSVDMKRHLNPTLPSPKVLAPESLMTSTESSTNKIFARAPMEKKQGSVASSPETKREKNVAGILQLVATIRIPYQSEPSNFQPNLSPLNNSAVDDLFDLAKYFSLKPSSTTTETNKNRQKRENFRIKKHRREKYFIKV